MRTLVLLGSGEFTPSMNEVDQYLISINNAKNIAVLPTAAGRETNVEVWIDKAMNHFLPFDVKVTGIPVYLPEDATNAEYIAKLKETSFIFFSGGDPGYLNSVLQGTPLWKEIYSKYKNGDILVGSSAGAMVMGKYILTNPQSVMLGTPDWKEGLGLIDYQVFPHYNMFTRFGGILIIRKLLTKKPDYVENRFLGIDEDTALIITDDKKAKVMGKGKVHVIIDKRDTIYKNGDQFEL